MSALESFPRPMSVGELLDRAITLYRRNFITLVGIVAVVNIPNLLVTIIAIVLGLSPDIMSFGRPSSASFSYALPLLIIIIAVLAIPFLIAHIFEQGALAVVASEFLLGRRAGIKQAYIRAFRRGWALFGAQILLGLLNAFIFGLLFTPMFALILLGPSLSSTSQGLGMGILSLCLCVAFLPAVALAAILNIHFIFWPQAIMLETQGARAGLGRSWGLVRGSFWRVFLIAAMTYIFTAVVSATPTYAISFATLLLPSPIIGTVLNSTVSILISIFVTPLWFALVTLLYYDLRIRKEGFDLEMQAQQIAETAV